MTRGSRAGTPLVSRISGLAYAARAKSVRLDLALIGFAGRLRDDQHSRLASPISTTKVETVHPHGFRIAAKFLGLHDVTTTIQLLP